MRQNVRPVYDDQGNKLGASVTISQRGSRRNGKYKRPWQQPGRQTLRTDDEAMLQVDDQLTSQTRRMLLQIDDQPMLTSRRPILKTNDHKTATAVLDIDVLEKTRHLQILNDGLASF